VESHIEIVGIISLTNTSVTWYGDDVKIRRKYFFKNALAHFAYTKSVMGKN